MRSEAQTVAEYLAELPEGRRGAIAAVREIILENLPKGYEEEIGYGMIAYNVPLSAYPDTYNKKPLVYISSANQKNYMVVYIMGLYAFPELKDEFIAAYKKAGKRHDLGACCVRFRTIEDLPLDLIGSAAAAIPMGKYIDKVRSARGKKS